MCYRIFNVDTQSQRPNDIGDAVVAAIRNRRSGAVADWVSGMTNDATTRQMARMPQTAYSAQPNYTRLIFGCYIQRNGAISIWMSGMTKNAKAWHIVFMLRAAHNAYIMLGWIGYARATIVKFE
jgi:hypothetical protein